eukprot:UN00668
MSNIDETFKKGLAFVENSTGTKLSQSDQLKFYALYKIANDGLCNTPAPSKLKFVAYAKWSAWNSASKDEKLTPQQAKEKYIAELTRLVPDWEKQAVPAKL